MAVKATLQRETFSTSRLLEFLSEKELQMRIGFGREVRWSHFSGHERSLAIVSFPGLWPKFSLASVS